MSGRVLRLMAIQKACSELLALGASVHERMVNGGAAASGEERFDFSAGIAWFGDILEYRGGAPRDRVSFGLCQSGGWCHALASGEGSAHGLSPLVPASWGARRGAGE